MADVAENLRTFLLAQSGVTALVGSRVYHSHVPQSPKRPFICFRLTDSRKERCLDDAVGTGPFSRTYAVESVDDYRDRAEEVRDAVNGVLDAYRGTIGDATAQGVFCESYDESYEPFSVSGDSGLHVAGMAVEVVA